MQKKISDLVKKLRLGEQQYFYEFYDLTKSAVFFTINKIVNNKQITEDLMQETYVAFVNNLHTIDENKNAYSYLLTTAKNKAINEYKRLQKIEYVDYIEDMPNEQPNLDAPLLKFAKQHLNADEWEILELTIIYGYKRVEVAGILNKPISTINWQYNQILKKIKEYYKEVYNEKTI